MGLCFSKKQQQQNPPPPPPPNQIKQKKPNKKAVAAAASEEKPQQQQLKKPSKPEEPVADKKPVFVVKTAPAAANGEERKKPAPREAAAVEEVRPAVSAVPVRTSSCTKEEVDAILIQCGRLSRSSSGKAASSETGGHRRYSGSKRSYDFDHEKRGGGDEECDWERQAAATVSRPSPYRRTPERKRSGSRERSSGNGGSRRVSRSPGRRSEGAPASSCSGERARQPAKMVSVPAREKGRAPSPSASGKRCASPRSHSPARVVAAANENANQATQTPSLSRSSSRKAEQSPYRRNPMAELDENSLRNNNAKPQKKSSENVIAVPQKMAERAKEQIVSCRVVKEKQAVVEPEIVEEAALSESKASSAKTNATHSVSIVAESLNTRAGPGSRSSRRSSRDFDHNPNSYASVLLEDIQNYHQQNTAAAPAFSLPACVSKACSILEAVADLNSSSSENRSYELDRSTNDKGSINGRYGKMGPLVVESEIVVKDDLMEPSLHKYVSVRDVRGETEPQESAGSNSFAGHPWTCSWEPNSIDSTDRSLTASLSNNGDEVEQGSAGTLSPLDRSQQYKQKASQEAGRSRAGASGNGQRGRNVHRGSGGSGGSIASGRSGVRAVPASS